MAVIQRIVQKFAGSAIELNKLRRFFAGVVHPEESSRRVMLYAGISSMYVTPTEVLLYHLLRSRGFDVDYMIYDESIPINEVITKERVDGEGKDAFWSRSCQEGKRKLEAANVPFQTIGVHDRAISIASEQKDLDAILKFQFEGIDFGNIVDGALYRFYKSLTIGEGAEEIARKMLITTLSNYFCVQERTEQNEYDFLLFSHGIYVTWQPIVEFCDRNGIDYVCYDRAKTQDHANFNVNRPSPDWSFDTAWERFSDRSLSVGEQKRVHDYLGERELQKGDVYAYNFSGKASDLKKEKERLGIPEGRRCVTIFTNLIWDAANVSRDIAFSTALECVTTTIDHFRDRNDVQVILRAHPAERVLGTKERYVNLVLEHYGGQVPENVTLISPEDDVNSFTIIEISDVGVVNTSTVGLEMAVLGKPVVLISETHYRGKGFTRDVTDPKDYLAAVEELLHSGGISDQQQKLAEKYFFMMMFLYQQHLPTRYRGLQFLGYSADHFSELSDSEPLVRIVNQLARQLPDDFVHWSSDDSAVAP